MASSSVGALAGVALLLAAAGCAGGGDGPWLTASWTGSDSGKVAASPTVAWCPLGNRLEIQARREDLGFGLVLYPLSELAAGDYPVFDPGIDSVRRPGAAGAARWFTELKIVGYQSDSGSVGLARSGGRVRLEFRLRMRTLDGRDTIRAVGVANGLIPGRCQADSVPNPTPTQ